jgi:hypothetical protein
MAHFDNEPHQLLYTLHFRVSPSEEVAIAMAARRSNRTVSGLLRHVLRSYLDLTEASVTPCHESAHLSPTRAEVPDCG